jgi:hypothetical protein
MGSSQTQSTPEPLQVVELAGEALDVAGAVAVAVGEPADEHLVEDRPLEPQRVARLLEADQLPVLVAVLLGGDGHERLLVTAKTWAGSVKGSRRT